jgi:precorrin-2/cobalt-factor-2 C20-methyltransferase
VTQVKAEKRELTFSMARDWSQRRAGVRENAEQIFVALKAGKDCAFATLGDPMTYSTFGYLLKILQEELPDLEIEVVPGITSFAALAAKSKTVLVEDDESLHVFPGQNVERPETIELLPKSANIILKSYKNRNRLVEYFSGQEGCSLIYGSRLCLDGEFTATDAQAIIAHEDEYLSLMIIKKD